MRMLSYTLMGTGFSFLMTAAGAAVVFFFRKNKAEILEKILLGFAAGIMIAASFWSLLEPAIEQAQEFSLPSWVPAGVGFFIGGACFIAVDAGIAHYRKISHNEEKPGCMKKNSLMLLLAVVLHNIPEGMAVGIAFVGAGQEKISLSAAFAIAFGIGIQNIPEGAAVALPLRKEGMRAGRAFLYGSLSGIVEPIFGMLTLVVFSHTAKMMPWMLSFAAGAMFYVVIAELIPKARREAERSEDIWGFLMGFLLMMILDVSLGA